MFGTPEALNQSEINGNTRSNDQWRMRGREWGGGLDDKMMIRVFAGWQEERGLKRRRILAEEAGAVSLS